MTGTTLPRVLARSAEIERIIARLAHQIVEPNDAEQGLVLLGVRRGGEALATRIAGEIARISGRAPSLGFLNINLYRDDRVTHELPESQIPLDLSGRIVVVVDDVLYTGRTIRSALDAVTDLGRPSAIRLCVLVDRGLRELPIKPDYVGRLVPTTPRERVKVILAAQPASGDEITITAIPPEERPGADTP
jgi:pyrimidine operon attenuation protein / uracil phosphoribosyltransferase